MLMYCFLRTQRATSVDYVFVATCDDEIAQVASKYGAQVILTSDTHLNAVDRTAEAYQAIEAMLGSGIEAVALVQGDEPLLDPTQVDSVVGTLYLNREYEVVNVMVPFSDDGDFGSAHNPKVVVDTNSNALYFSRSPIPSPWLGNSTLAKMQTGLFAFRPAALRWFAQAPKSRLEDIEKIDMLRFVESGKPVHMLQLAGNAVGVDTVEDLERARAAMAGDLLFASYAAEWLGK